MSLTTYTAPITKAYRAFVAEKKSPTTKQAMDPKAVASLVSRELATVRTNVAMYESVLRRTKPSLPKPWAAAAKDAIAKMKTYAKAFEKTLAAWRKTKPSFKSVSVYPMTSRNNTGIALTESVNALFKAIRDTYEGGNNSRRILPVVATAARPVTTRAANAPNAVYPDVQRAWTAYTASVSKTTKPRSSVPADELRRLEDEITVLDLNATQFEAILDRVRRGSALAKQVRAVLALYDTYRKDYTKAYRQAKRKQQPTRGSPFGPEGTRFNQTVVKYMKAVLASVSKPGDAPLMSTSLRRKSRPPPLNTAALAKNLRALQNTVYSLESSKFKSNANRDAFKRQANYQRQLVSQVTEQLERVEDALRACESDKEDLRYYYDSLYNVTEKANRASGGIFSNAGRAGIKYQRGKVLEMTR